MFPLFQDEPVPCTKEEYAIAKYVRFNTLAHEGKLAGMTVKCFIGKANPHKKIFGPLPTIWKWKMSVNQAFS